MDNIKLVIWDLDETFWRGTLSEEGIELIEKHIKIVKELTGRGIMSSIVSKNDFEQAKRTLEDAGVWDHFIFPAVEWSPKGPLIKQTIKDCQLRAGNVLFIDDNHMNLKEAQYYNPNLHVKGPDFISKILEHPAFKGKDDRSHSRLKQYKILEEKAEEKKDYSSNEEFLRSSEIKIRFIKELEPHKERLYELLNRTNQLNYTKKRLNEGEIDELIADPTTKALIRVSDKFGDYGIVGFYSLNESQNILKHFTFSCRIINLGIVQYVYHKLNQPKIKIIPEVAELLSDSKPDWITENEIEMLPEKKKVNNSSFKTRLFFKGSCELDWIFTNLENDLAVETIRELQYPNRHNITVRSDHTHYIIEADIIPKRIKNKFIANIPFIENDTYSNAIFTTKYDVLVLSVVSDYYQNVYKHNHSDYHIAFGYPSEDLTNPNNESIIIEKFKKRNASGINHGFLHYFRENFTSTGRITSEIFTRHLEIIRHKIPSDISIIFMNGTELSSDGPNFEGIQDRHALMNLTLDKFIRNSSNCYLFDIRNIVYSQKHLTSHNRHFVREKYVEIGQVMFRMVEKIIDQQVIKPMPFSVKRSFTNAKKYLIRNKIVPPYLHNMWRVIRGRPPL